MVKHRISNRIPTAQSCPGHRQDVVRESHDCGRQISREGFDVSDNVSFQIDACALGGEVQQDHDRAG